MKRLMFMPDTHFPYHDRKAFRVFLHAVEEFEPDLLVLLGDVSDFYSVSSHDKDPRRKDRFEDEVYKSNLLLDKVEELGVPRVVFVEGNHEDRLRRHVWKQAPELVGLVTTEQVLQLDRRGWEFYSYKTHFQVGKLVVTHGTRSGKYSIHQTLLDMQHSFVIGHTHRLGYVIERNLLGESHVGMCPGWLGDFSTADFASDEQKRLWSHGFGIGYLERGGNIHLRPVPIVDGRCVIEGKLVK